MRETLEVLEKLESSREPRLRRQLDQMNAKVSAFERERAGFQQARMQLKGKQESMMQAHKQGQSVTGYELQMAAAHSSRIDHQIAEILESERNKEQQLALARTSAQTMSDRLARCIRRQAKLEKAIRRLGRYSAVKQNRKDEDQTDQLASIKWQRGKEF